MRDKVYFTSDAHLGSAYHTDPLETERRLVRWLESIRATARAIYFLGDMFDYWFEYKHVVPRGYIRFLGKVAELSDEGIEIHFFAGNHDVWFRDYVERELGAKVHHQSQEVLIDGKCFRLSHGDAEYRQVSWINNALYCLFRNKLARCLYGSIHPRWTVGLAMSWSLSSRRKGQKRETLGEVPHAYHNAYFEVEQEPLVIYTKGMIEQFPHIDYYLYGHRHLMLDLALKQGKRLLILGDWLRYNSYAVWDGTYLTLEQFEPNEG